MCKLFGGFGKMITTTQTDMAISTMTHNVIMCNKLWGKYRNYIWTEHEQIEKASHCITLYLVCVCLCVSKHLLFWHTDTLAGNN